MTETGRSSPSAATFALFLNGDKAAVLLPHVQEIDPLALKVLGEKIAILDDGDLGTALADAAEILVAEYPAVAQVQQTALAGENVRGVHPPDPETIKSMLDFLRSSPALIPLIAVALRIVGENRVKFGKFELKTGSVLKDLAGIVKFWK